MTLCSYYLFRAQQYLPPVFSLSCILPAILTIPYLLPVLLPGSLQLDNRRDCDTVTENISSHIQGNRLILSFLFVFSSVSSRESPFSDLSPFCRPRAFVELRCSHRVGKIYVCGLIHYPGPVFFFARTFFLCKQLRRARSQC